MRVTCSIREIKGFDEMLFGEVVVHSSQGESEVWIYAVKFLVDLRTRM